MKESDSNFHSRLTSISEAHGLDTHDGKFREEPNDVVPFLSHEKGFVTSLATKSQNFSTSQLYNTMENINTLAGKYNSEKRVRKGTISSLKSSNSSKLPSFEGNFEDSNGSNFSRPLPDTEDLHLFQPENTKNVSCSTPIGTREKLTNEDTVHKSHGASKMPGLRNETKRPACEIPNTTNQSILPSEKRNNLPMPLHDVLLEADRQQNEEFVKVVPNPYLAQQQVDVYVLSNEHHYEELKELTVKRKSHHQKVRLSSTSSSAGSNRMSVKDQRSTSDYLSSSASSSYDSSSPFRMLKPNEDDSVYTQDDELSYELDNSTMFRIPVQHTWTGYDNGTRSVLKAKKRRKEHQINYSRSISSDKNVSKRVKSQSTAFRDDVNGVRIVRKG